jgi:hypothetical protein
MRRFIYKFAAFALPALAIFGVPTILIAAAGELTPIDSVVERQLGSAPLVYGPAYTNPVKRFKLRATEKRRPAVLALGSSRVMQFRADFFREPARFYNAGGAVVALRDARYLLGRLSAQAQPALVILGLDQWFFNPRWSEPVDAGPHAFDVEETPLNVIQRNWRTVYRSLANGKIDVLRCVAHPRAVGLTAVMRGNGFRNDGSYLYGDVIRAPDAPDRPDLGFADTFSRIENGERRFEWSDAIDDGALVELDKMLADAGKRGIHVTAFLPPLAPSVAARVRASGRYGYLPRILAAVSPSFAAHGAEIIDLSDAADLGARDDEFIDGFHGSDRTYLRIILRLAEAAPVVAAEVDRAALAARLTRATRFEAPPVP